MISLLYFSYGSNMSIRRLRQRAPSALLIDAAQLSDHALRFHKRGRDGSAKCDACFTGQPTDIVQGVLFQLDPGDKLQLDTIEGLGRGYAEKAVQIRTRTGEWLEAFTYFATDIEPSLRPYLWYVHHVLTGARENNLPAPYIQSIETVRCLQDPDPNRHMNELAVYS